MKLRILIGILLVCTWPLLAIAQSGRGGSAEPSVPRLGDIMNAAQLRHMKLWFAGKARNWDLAANELRLISASLEDAATLYTGIPVTNVTTMSAPIQSPCRSGRSQGQREVREGIRRTDKWMQHLPSVDGAWFCCYAVAHGTTLQQSGVSAAGQAIDTREARPAPVWTEENEEGNHDDVGHNDIGQVRNRHLGAVRHSRVRRAGTDTHR